MAFSPEHVAEKTLPDLFARWTGGRAGVEWERGRGGLDAVLSVGPHVFVVEVARDARAESLEGAISQVRHLSVERGLSLVVVPYMTPAGAARCQAAGVSWVDLSGNAHVEARSPHGDLVVHVSGQPNAFETRGRPRNAFAPKSARISRLLLSDPDTLWTQSDLAQATGIDPGHVSRIVGRLVKANLVARDRAGLVAVPEPARLLDAWAESNAYRHRVVEGHLPGRSGEDRARRLADGLRDVNEDHAFTGLAAAWAYTHAAGFRSVSCFVSGADVLHVLDEVGFRADTEAPNTRLLVPDDSGVLDGVRMADGLRCVAPVQAYVDLTREPERAEEFADALRLVALDPRRP